MLEADAALVTCYQPTVRLGLFGGQVDHTFELLLVTASAACNCNQHVGTGRSHRAGSRSLRKRVALCRWLPLVGANGATGLEFSLRKI